MTESAELGREIGNDNDAQGVGAKGGEEGGVGDRACRSKVSCRPPATGEGLTGLEVGEGDGNGVGVGVRSHSKESWQL